MANGYPFQEKGGSHSKSKTSHRKSGHKDPRHGAPHNIQQPRAAQSNSHASDQGSQMGNSAPQNPTTPVNNFNQMAPRESKRGGFGALGRGR